jgi:acetate kinase
MKILVANLGSTTFKYRLLDMTDQRQLARGAVDRIGSEESLVQVDMGGRVREALVPVPDHAAAVQRCLADLTDPETGCLASATEVSAIGLKAVFGGRISGVQRVTPEVLDAMEEASDIAPAHNPPYVAAMRLLREKLPEIPLVAAFETGFHATLPDRVRYFGIPYEWAEEFSIKRFGFHGASHRYIGTRIVEILRAAKPALDVERLRVISCHLGGSSSLCAIRGGASVATSMGMSPQSGVPQNNRVGDFDPYALPLLIKKTGKSLDELLAELAQRGGLLGLSGTSGDIRDLRAAAGAGDRRARLALDVYTTEVRRHFGGLLVELGGADVIVFTGGIGENSPDIRTAVCRDLEDLGIVLDSQANAAAAGEAEIGAASSRTAIWVVPTNEELIVARQTQALLEG